ncbi:hypothetical protein [Flavobacterium beibuense]|uniref:Lipoprotein n=1 Tax=Flavobacterium beibuense TaxID=657326 RepID=A0A444W8E4_9FLAO|nr:hypothetical protein [Flavobacterium beibuense]RYJ42134.1 hypothetical protein NU09_2538 [Flavobacterium beibuense]
MKKFIYGILSLAAISLASCDYHDPNDGKFGGESSAGWVEFEEDGVSYLSVVQGSGSTVEATIPVVIKSVDLIDLNNDLVSNNPVNNGLTVYYTIEDIDGSSAYLNASGSVYIPKGELSANIAFTVPASAQVSCTEFKVTLTSTSNSNVSVGFEENNIVSQTFVVGAYDLNAMVGTYNALLDGEDQYQCNVTLGEEPNSLIIGDIYGIAPGSQTTIYVNEDGSISFPDYTDNFLFTNGGTSIYVEGFNGLSTCLNGGTMALSFRLRTTTTLYATNSLVLTKQ